MAVALSPWPTSPAARTAAIACLKQVVGGIDDDRLDSLGAAAAGRVENFAPGAPQNVKDQCVELLAAHIHQSKNPFYNVQSTQLVRPVNFPAMFRNCGAAGLLSPWKRRRAGAIGAKTD